MKTKIRTGKKAKRWFKRTVSFALTAAMSLSLLTLPAKAAAENVFLEEAEIPEEILSSDVFYLATTVAELQEGANKRYILRIGRGGDCASAAGVTLKITDLSAKLGKDYTISLVARDDSEDEAEAELAEDSQSLVELFQENDYEETAIMSAEEYAELMAEDEDLYNATVDAYNETLDYIVEESGILDDTDGDTAAETAEPAAADTDGDGTLSMQEARSAFTGISGDAQEITATTDMMAQLQDMTDVLTNAVPGSELTVDFEEGESERYIAIDVVDNKTDDGTRYFSLMLTEPYGTTVNSSMSTTSVTISDDEEHEPAVVGFSQSEYTAEGDTLSVEITRTGAINDIVTAQLTSVSGTAQTGRDFSRVNATIIFPMGVEKRVVEIPIRTEYISGEAEFELKLEADAGCVIEEDTATVKMMGTLDDTDESTDSPDTDTDDDVQVSLSANEGDTLSTVVIDDGIDLGNDVSDVFNYSMVGQFTNKVRSVNGMSSDNAYYIMRYYYNWIWPLDSLIKGYVLTRWKLSSQGYDIAGAQIDWEKSGKSATIGASMCDDWSEISTFTTSGTLKKGIPAGIFSTSAKQNKITIQNSDHGHGDILKIYSIKRVYRPFDVALKEPDTKSDEALTFLDENGNYSYFSGATSGASIVGGNSGSSTASTEIIRYTRSDKNSITLQQSETSKNYTYIKNIDIIDSNGNAKALYNTDFTDDTIGSRTITMDTDWVNTYADAGYIQFLTNQSDKYKNQDGTYGLYGKVTLRPVYGYKNATIYVDNSTDLGTLKINGAEPDLEGDGEAGNTTTQYHIGDILKISVDLNEKYADAYVVDGFNLKYKASESEETPRDITVHFNGSDFAYLDDSQFSHRLQHGYYLISPNIVPKNNVIKVRVKEDDLEYFDTKYGIFTMDEDPESYTINGINYKEYTAYSSPTNGTIYSLAARTNDSTCYTNWKEPSSNKLYTGDVFFHEAGRELDTNIIDLSVEHAEDYPNVYQEISGSVKRPNYNMQNYQIGSDAVLPATGAFVNFGTACATVESDGTYTVPWFRTLGNVSTSTENHWIRYVISYNDANFLREQQLSLSSGSPDTLTADHDFTVTDSSGSASVETRETTYQKRTLNMDSISAENGSIISSITLSTNVTTSDSQIPIDGDSVTITANCGTAKYTRQTINSSGVVVSTAEATETVTGVEFGVYDPNTYIKMYSYTAEEGEDGTFSAKIDLTNIIPSYALYISVTTDRGQDIYTYVDEDGNTVTSADNGSIDVTTYPDVYTGYSFYQATETELPIQVGIDMDLSEDDTSSASLDSASLYSTSSTSKEFINLPYFGNATAGISIADIVTVTCQVLDNGAIRLTLGANICEISNDLSDKKSGAETWTLMDESDPTTGESKYSKWKDKLSKSWDKIKEDYSKRKSGKAESFAGTKSISVGVEFGVYADFGKVTMDGASSWAYMGGGIYAGASLEFERTMYGTLSFIPVYGGIHAEFGLNYTLGMAMDTSSGIISYEDVTQQKKKIELSRGNSSSQLKLGVLFEFYAGIGLYKIAGARGTVSVEAAGTCDIPKKVDHRWGFALDVQGGVTVDALILSYPFMWTIVDLNFGSFKDYEEKAKANLSAETDTTDASLNSTNKATGFSLRKPYTDEESVWTPEEVSLMSGFSEKTSGTIIDNAYEHPDVQLVKLSDGSIFMAFLDNDLSRGDYDRTVLKYSIFKDGAWSEPVIIQEDTGGDFQPSVCEMTDGKVMISWLSRDPNQELTGTTEDYLTKSEIYTAVIDTQNNEISELTQLTNDCYFDHSPVSLYDETSGDRAVFYVKNSETEDAEAMINPGSSNCAVVYMLYSAEEGRWLDDYYYDNEVADNTLTDALIEQWNGQRFLASPIEELGIDVPNINDFTATTYNGYVVLAYTVDVDSSYDTSEDRELFVQLYDFDTHTASDPIRLSDDGYADSLPQFVKTGSGEDADVDLFWYRNDKGVAYVGISSLITAGLDENGDISEEFLTSNDGETVFDLDSLYAYVMPNTDNIDEATAMSDFRVTADDNDIYVVWTHPSTYEDEDGNTVQSTEIYATALTHEADNEDIGATWSNQYRLTYDGMFTDEPEVAIDSEGNMMVLYNRYNQEITDDEENPVAISDFELRALYMEPCGEVYVTDIDFSDDTPQAGDTITLNIDVENHGLTYADGYTVELYEMKDGVQGELIDTIVSDNYLLPGNMDEHEVEWTIPEDFDGVSVYAVAQEGGMSNTSDYESEAIVSEAEYDVDNVYTYQDNDGYHICFRVTNTGNTTSTDEDVYHVELAGPYDVPLKYSDVDDEFAVISIAGIAPGESADFDEVLTIEPTLFDECGYVDILGVCQDGDENYLSDTEYIRLNMGRPLAFLLDGEEYPTEITLNVGDTMEFNVSCEPVSLDEDLTVAFGTEDPSIAAFNGTTLKAEKAGTTTIYGYAIPYGNTLDEIVVTVLGEDDTDATATPEPTATAEPTATPEPTATATTEPTSSSGGTSGTSGSGSTSSSTSTSMSGGTTTAVTPATATSTSALPFKDVAESDWFYNDVLQVYTNGIMNGVSADSFEPDSDVTRGMLVTTLARTAGVDEGSYSGAAFDDVDESKYYAPFIAWAAENGIVDGYGDNSFGPDDAVTREQAAKIIMSYESFLENGTDGAWAIHLNYTDVGSIDDWAVEGIMYCTLNGIMQGNDEGAFKPLDNIRRSECAAVLNRLP